MINFSPFPAQNITGSGEVALYDKLKEMAEWMWDCITCQLPCCQSDEYDNLHEEEEDQRAASNKIPTQTEQIQIETEVPAPKDNKKQLKDLEELKVDIEQIDSVYQDKTTSQFDDLELSNLTNSKKKFPIDSFPREKLFILQSSYSQMLAKIQDIKLKTPAKVINTQENSLKEDVANDFNLNDPNFLELGEDAKLQQLYEERYSIFSKYREGVRISKEDWESATPEIMAKYVAKRLGSKFKTASDAFCGAGSSTIQLAVECERVFSFDHSRHNIENGTKNAEIYGVSDKIEFIQKDFLDTETIKTDVVYINLWRRDVADGFNLWKDSNPSLKSAIDTAFMVSENFAVLLPARSRLEELVEIIYETIDKHDSYSKRSIIEIEQIKLDNKDDAIFVLYGNASSVSVAEEVKALGKVFKLDTEKNAELQKLVENEGLWRAFKQIAQESDSKKNQSISNIFS